MEHLLDLTRDFEASFGEPSNEASEFSFVSSHRLDERSEFPSAVVERLNNWGLAHYYVPVAYGGKLGTFDELFQLLRLVARRDLAVAIAHGKTMLGSVSVWIAGSDAQREATAHRILAGEPISLAVTERTHGSDIFASETRVADQDGAFLLSGEKYLINNATRSTALTLFARTANNKNARDFSLFLVEKERLRPGSYSHLPKVKTHGMKAADISGIRFDQAELTRDMLIGKPGDGVEITFCGFQITRTLCAALSCGGGDHGLRLAYRFASQRRFQGATLTEHPAIRRTLGQACADLLIGDIVGLFACRAINVIPTEMSVISAIAKAFVPARIEARIESLADVLGAQACLEGETEYDSFSKLQRDSRLVSVFDGNTLVNLQSLMLQLPTLARRRRDIEHQASELAMRQLFDLSQPAPAWLPQRLTLSNKGQATITNSLFRASERFGALHDLSPDIRGGIQAEIASVLDTLADIDRFFSTNPAPVKRIDKLFFDMAEQYCKVFAAACCVQAFLHNRARLAPGLQDGRWLLECLAHLNHPRTAKYQSLLSRLRMAVSSDQLISIFPFSLSDYQPVQEAA